MPAAPNSPVHRQVTKASRRLFTQSLLDALVWCWSGALLVSALWFVAQPWLLPPTEAWVRWAVAGGVFAAASAMAVALAAKRAPSHVYAALELDQRFQLKERVTSSLTLTPDLEATAAGQALVADANEQVAKVDVNSRFPVRLSWTATLVPAAGLVLALIAIFYNPVFETATADAGRPKDQIKMVNAKEIEQRFNNLKKPTSLKFKKDGDQADKHDEIEKLWEKLLHEPLDPTSQDKVRERLQQMVPLEDKLKDRMEDLKAQQERNKEMQKKLQEMGKDPNQRFQQDGPANGVEDALNQGDLEKAQKEMQALADKLKKNQLDEEQRKQLEKQLDEIQKKLNDAADQNQLKDKLQKDLADGKLAKEDFDKQMGKAGDQADKMKDLKEVGKKLEESKDALDKGDNNGAADKLGEAAKQMQKLDPKGAEMKQLQEAQQNLQDLRNEMQKGLGNQANTPPGGERPAAKDGKTGAKDEKQKGELDANTQFRVDGTQKGGTFSKIPANQVGGAFHQAQQDAPEAIERQQVPPDAADFLKGYYENLGGGKKK